jgi:cytochrome P450
LYSSCRIGLKLAYKQTVVGISNLFVHFDPEIFPDPHAFKPERWLEAYADANESLDHWLVAFSKGPRSCLGMKYVVEVVLRNLTSNSFLT